MIRHLDGGNKNDKAGEEGLTSDQHERFVHDAVNLLLVGLDTDHAVLGEGVRSIGQQTDGLQQVLDQHRLEHVELKVTIGAGNRNRRVVAHDLSANHGHRLALGRVDLARHNRRSRFVFWQGEFAETAARTGTKETNVVGDLHERHGNRVESTVSLDNGVVSSQSFKLVFFWTRNKSISYEVAHTHAHARARARCLFLYLVGSRLEWHTGDLGNGFSNLDIETLASVQAGADSRTALGKVVQARKGGLDTLDAKGKLLDVARELLTERQGSGVLQVRTTNLDNVAEFFRLLLQSVAQLSQGRQKALVDFHDSSDVHGRGEAMCQFSLLENSQTCMYYDAWRRTYR